MYLQTGCTPLHTAVANKNLNICRLLIEEGKADVNCPDNVGISIKIFQTYFSIRQFLRKDTRQGQNL